MDNLDINHMLIMSIRADGCRQTELIKRTTHVMSLSWMQQTIDSSACHLVKIKIDTKNVVTLEFLLPAPRAEVSSQSHLIESAHVIKQRNIK